MAETNELEAGLQDLHRSWSRIHRGLIPRTLFSVIMHYHSDPINYVIGQFSQRTGVRTMDSRLIPATTGGIPKEAYEQFSKIREEKKDEAYAAILSQILKEMQPSLQLMFTGMKYHLFKDHFLEETGIKPGDEYVKEEIEFEMRNGDGSYRRHVPKMYAEQITSNAIQLSALGKDKLMDLYQERMEKQEEQEPQSRLILPGQMHKRSEQGRPQRSPRRQPQQPKPKETKSGLIIATLDDINKFGK